MARIQTRKCDSIRADVYEQLQARCDELFEAAFDAHTTIDVVLDRAINRMLDALERGAA